MPIKINQQCTRCRRVGTKLFLKGEKCSGAKCTLIKRNYPAGQHGLSKKRTKKSGYGKQLMEKQQAKEVYGLLERQLFNYMRKAAKKQGDSSEFLLGYLEARLDNVVYRFGLANSRRAARQLVNHGHIVVNGKKLDIPSYQVKVGDVIGLKIGTKAKPAFAKIAEKLNKIEPVNWLNIDAKQASAKVINRPTVENPPFDVRAIIEFYTRKI